ncbi:MAG TPA: transposase [Acidimicrobiales bacterium]|nr:transposase [Acidimicrobiales bacterium]
MDADMDTCATAPYGKIDDELATNSSLRIWRPEVGTAPRLSDAELLTMAVLQALFGFTSETRFLRYANKHLGGYTPYLPHQSGCNRRLRKSQAQLNALIRVPGHDTDLWDEDNWVIDSTPVECGRSGPTVKRGDRAESAGYGYCAGHSRYFWGLRLHLVCTPCGVPVTFALANPKVDEREVARDLFEIDPDLLGHRPGPVILAGKGYVRPEFEGFLATRDAQPIRPARKGAAPRLGARFLKPLRAPDRVGQRNPQRPARTGTTRRAHPPRCRDPGAAATARPDCCQLAQPPQSTARPAFTHRL